MPEKLIELVHDVPEGQWWWHITREVGPDDNVLLSSQVDGSPPYILNVYDTADMSVPVYTRSGALSTEIIVPITVNSYWTVDQVGYNLFDIVKADGTHFVSTGGKTYIAEWRLNTSQFGPIFSRHVWNCRSAQST